MINVLIVHYNTPKLTEACVKSINKHTPNCKIYIFDNSDTKPFTAFFDNVEIIDNTKGLIIDFDKWLELFPKKEKSSGAKNKWASAKHCYTIQKAIELIKKPLIHIDSDALIKKDFSSMFNTNYLWVADIGTRKWSGIKRVIPYIMFLNVPEIINNGILFFDSKRMHGLNAETIEDKMDTGASFYLDTFNKFKTLRIKKEDYIEHLKAGSWKDKNSVEWLNKYKNLYE